MNPCWPSTGLQARESATDEAHEDGRSTPLGRPLGLPRGGCPAGDGALPSLRDAGDVGDDTGGRQGAMCSSSSSSSSFLPLSLHHSVTNTQNCPWIAGIWRDGRGRLRHRSVTASPRPHPPAARARRAPPCMASLHTLRSPARRMSCRVRTPETSQSARGLVLVKRAPIAVPRHPRRSEKSAAPLCKLPGVSVQAHEGGGAP